MIEQLEGRMYFAAAAVDRSMDVSWIGTVTLASNGTLLITGLGNSQDLTITRRSGASMSAKVMENPRATKYDTFIYRASSPFVERIVLARDGAKLSSISDPIRRSAGDGPALVIQAPGGSNVVVPINLVRHVRIETLGGNDRVTLKGVKRPTTVLGGAGNDTIVADMETNRIMIDGGSGNDTMVVQAPGSNLVGGAGRDRVVGDPDDVVSGVEVVDALT
jgi:Ca2+-binding RTX toxin-like protein